LRGLQTDLLKGKYTHSRRIQVYMFCQCRQKAFPDGTFVFHCDVVLVESRLAYLTPPTISADQIHAAGFTVSMVRKSYSSVIIWILRLVLLNSSH
jgi:hypothetical protein